jgi:hypothetical protein
MFDLDLTEGVLFILLRVWCSFEEFVKLWCRWFFLQGYNSTASSLSNTGVTESVLSARLPEGTRIHIVD